jgi:predicted AAA+ superfamily ATPase
MKEYLKRTIDDVLKEELEAFGAVLITGPKWCGKTTTAFQIAKSTLFMHDPNLKDNLIELAKLNVNELLKGDKPRLIDEWQSAPELWDAIRFDIDQKGEEGLYILTGSTIVDESKISHSGAGRISRLNMRTMSLYETSHSNGAISLANLFDGEHNISSQSKLGLEDYIDLIIRGGWPNTINKSLNIAVRQIKGYVDIVCKSDIREIDGVQRDEIKTKAILKSLSRHISTSAADTTILANLKENDISMDIDTLRDYINVLKKLYIIEDLPAWSTKLRSKSVIRLKNTRHFVDPAIGASLLNANKKNLLGDLNTLGFLFESLVIRDLRIYSQHIDGNVSHYRDSSGLEADAVIQLDDGRWGAIEVKLGLQNVDDAARNLIKLEKLVEKNKPSFLAVITGTKYAYKREDGVLVIPIGCLRP